MEAGTIDKEPLGGVQPLSIRVHFLRNLAKKGNPVLKWGARYLLTDRACRRNGMIFETLVLYGYSALVILFLYFLNIYVNEIAFNLSNDGILTETSVVDQAWESFNSIYLNLNGINFITGIIIYITGAIISTRVINALYHGKPDTKTPNLVKEHPDEVFNSLMTLQMFSIGSPYLIFIIITIIGGYIFLQNPNLGEVPDYTPGLFSNTQIFWLINQILGLLFLALGSIYSGLRYPEAKAAFWMFILLTAIYAITLIFGLGLFYIMCRLFLGWDHQYLTSEQFSFYTIWAIALIYALFLLARNEVRSKIKKLQKSN